MNERTACVVAIPANNEADRIGACLAAVLDQRDAGGLRPMGERVEVVVFANNCTDATARIARGFGPRVRVVEAALEGCDANAGVARRRAMDLAAQALEGVAGGLICTTDADSRPRPDWLAHLRAAIGDGAEAVAGAVDFDDGDLPPMGFGAPRRQEALYSALQAELIARLDPEPHNPWPNHIWAWGANLAVTAEAYRRVGGLPTAPLAEDRAFVERLKAFDVPVRHCLAARVWTSARRDGRAPGGLASLVADHLEDDVCACDAALEPAAVVVLRARARARFRPAFAAGRSDPGLARLLHLAPADLRAALADAAFGAGWARLETMSPRLRRRRLSPADLPREIAHARRRLSRMGADGPGDLSDRARAATAGLWSRTPPSP